MSEVTDRLAATKQKMDELKAKLAAEKDPIAVDELFVDIYGTSDENQADKSAAMWEDLKSRHSNPRKKASSQGHLEKD